ncbi:conserved hypothetical protein [Ricinus communis]|uniref:EF-hand domain-containing protein n=1 Tax=Ricinus communis TaxID=3988 RepID=B9SMS7_RICCO|nr:conserved hypothetical protein [Ricinus communis]
MHSIPLFKQKKATSPLSKHQLREIFKQFDLDGNHVLSKNEMKKAFDNLGSRCPLFRAYFANRYADGNGDGVIDLNNSELDALVDYAFKIQYTRFAPHDSK